ncbi:MAG: deoxyribose-phosphate aldolase [Faecalibacillus sp.]
MNYNKMIDHTVLKADTTKETVKRIFDEAMEYGFASVCINPCHVKFASEYLKDSDVKVCTVIGFPLGATTSSTKAFETNEAIENGADEIDMVMNIGAMKDKNYDYVLNDIQSVVKAAKGKVVKVILETCLLTKEEIREACQICQKAGADFVKTSTGFSMRGATIEDVEIMKATVGDAMKVKAAGGVRTYEDMVKIVEAGADRIGTSAGCSLVKGKEAKSDY